MISNKLTHEKSFSGQDFMASCVLRFDLLRVSAPNKTSKSKFFHKRLADSISVGFFEAKTRNQINHTCEGAYFLILMHHVIFALWKDVAPLPNYLAIVM